MNEEEERNEEETKEPPAEKKLVARASIIGRRGSHKEKKAQIHHADAISLAHIRDEARALSRELLQGKTWRAVGQLARRQAAAGRTTEVAATFEIYLSEANCRRFRERNPGSLDQLKRYSLEDIDINPNLSDWAKNAIKALIKKWAHIFAKHDGEPAPLAAEIADKVSMKTRPGCRVSHCAKPTYGKFQREILKAYRIRGTRDGFFVRSKSNWAARMHLCMKPGKDEIRKAIDYRGFNKATEKLPPNLPNMDSELQKQQGSRFFTSTDAIKGYHHLTLDEETQEKLAVWLDDGLYQPTRLMEGSKNAGVYFQEAMNRAMELLPPDAREKVSNYMDDLLCGQDEEEWLRNTEALFEMCSKAKITLHPKKTRLGYETAKMVGHEVGGGKITVHADNLAPLKTAVAPANKSEVRQFLGICGYGRKHVKEYAQKAKPLTELTGTKPFEWGPREQASFEEVKADTLKNFPLHTADYSKPFYLFTDASDVGAGAMLCQLTKEIEDADIGKLQDHEKKVIAFYSAAWDEAMAKKPVYYREARALIWAMGKAKRHLECAQRETVLVSDHKLYRIFNNHNYLIKTACFMLPHFH